MNSNFSWAFLVLPRHKREGLHTLYQFCRAVDDLVDEAQAHNILLAQKQLNQWKSILDRLSHPSVFDPPLAHQLSSMVSRFSVDRNDLYWIIEGVEKDLTKNRYETFEELLTYCDGVASAVGLACLTIFGADRKKTMRYAFATGRALQLTNILRDIASDARRGRIYLPLSDLQQYEYPEKYVKMSLYNESFIRLMKFEVDRAKMFFAQAEDALPKDEKQNLLAAETMRRTYRLLLNRIESNHYNVYPRKIRLSPIHKMSLMVSALHNRFLRAS